MKNNYLFIIFFIIFIVGNSYASENFKFESKSIEILNSSKIIKAKDGVKVTSNNNIEILALESTYNKNTQILNLIKDVNIKDIINNITLSSEKVIYNKKEEIIFFPVQTKINYGSDYRLFGKNITYDKENSRIFSDEKAILKDKQNNILNLLDFDYSINEKVVFTTKLNFIDKKQNIYNSSNSIIDLNNEKISSKDIELYLNEKGELGQNARLIGSSLKSEKNLSIINDGIFTTCKKEKCPPWSLKSKKITHDKKNKLIKYDKSVLQFYDIPVFYFPKFFHPDPSVKRQSGFLIPSIINSSTNGNSFKIPYYHVVSENKDFTLTPQFYLNKDFLIQNEYRQKEKYTSHITDFSLKKFENSSKSHFFSNTKKIIENSFDYSEIEINLEKTSNDTYLKKSKIKTNTRENDNQSLLNSYIKFNANNDEYKIFSEMSVYEDLSKSKNSDKYQYVFPNFTLSKTLKTELNLNGKFNFQVSGSNRLKETNVEEKYLINDLTYDSENIFSKFGSISNFEVFLKNTSKKGKNSTVYDDKTKTENYSSIAFSSSLPLKKESSNFISNLTPRILARYNPDKSENISNLDRQINSTNLFSTNRLGLNDSLEGGQSFTVGFDYDLNDDKNNKLFGLNLGQIFRDTSDRRFPKKSTMQNKSSDIIGNLDFLLIDNLDLNYEFSADNNLDIMNLSKLDATFNVNNFVTTFEFLEENNDIGSNSYLSNNIKYTFNNMNSLMYNTRRNRKTDLTEYYNLIYEYKNDCLVAAIEYNKDYYKDRDLKPSEEIFFKITITPFASINSPSLK